MMHDWMMNNLGGGWMMLVWWLIIIGAIVLFFKLMPSGWGNQNPYPEESALDVLRKRYAQGEITREEYEERLQVLKHS